jgi:hypothetical protein
MGLKRLKLFVVLIKSHQMMWVLWESEYVDLWSNSHFLPLSKSPKNAHLMGPLHPYGSINDFYARILSHSWSDVIWVVSDFSKSVRPSRPFLHASRKPSLFWENWRFLGDKWPPKIGMRKILIMSMHNNTHVNTSFDVSIAKIGSQFLVHIEM